MKPTATIGDCDLYLGDCRDILPLLPKVDAVVTDPPYGVSGVQNTRNSKTIAGKKNAYASIDDSVEFVLCVVIPIIEECIARYGVVVVTPGNKCAGLYPNPDSWGALYQPASVGLQSWGRADAQPILYYGKSPYGGKELPSQRCSFVNTETAEYFGHPCSKPIGVVLRLVSNASRQGHTVIDPFMGSGTTGVACVKLGRKFIGIEIEPKYFDIACRRIEAAYAQPDLFVSAPSPKPEQLGMFTEAAE